MKRYALAFAVMLIAAPAATSAFAHEITLNATIRDFRESHPDFQLDLADDHDYVDSTLGGDKKPVYIGGAGTATTSGAANYNQWYNDTPGVNMTTTRDLTLSNGMANPGGVYTFSAPSFFPIDGELFGNENSAHNYYFTLELHTAFTYQAGMTFNVTADDDLIIFIDNQKVIDLGGIHPPQNGSLDLDTLGLTAGQTYDFDLFFAERRKVLSSLSFDTSIQFIPEPATAGLTLLGGLSLLIRRKRKTA
ncbi:MAG TPA: fibro-slime domain-containing protein [Phycisphaerae bacterium]|nr:fibro-slime domain-containing protein [Phycisphaerae bacterium]HRW55292.1 fibro-slime domain-containing protein [Phycisphaerae bacterium]